MQQVTDATHTPATQPATPADESSVRRTVVLCIVIIIVALVGVFASRFCVSPRGATSPALLVATQPTLAIAAVLVAMIIALLRWVAPSPHTPCKPAPSATLFFLAQT